MCGVFGYTGVKDSVSRGILVTVLADAMERRGSASWGTALINRKGDFRIVKGVGAITDKSPIREIASYSTVLGHTRFPTHGAVTPENAHPFKYAGYVFLHNGGIYNHSYFDAKCGEKNVDSMHLGRLLCGQIDAAKISGYGTLVWFDTATKSVEVVRWNGGDLCVAQLMRNKQSCGLVFASEENAVKNAARLAGYEPIIYDIEEKKVYRFDEDNQLWLTKKEFNFGDRSVYRSGARNFGCGYEYDYGEYGNWKYYKNRGSSTSSTSDKGASNVTSEKKSIKGRKWYGGRWTDTEVFQASEDDGKTNRDLQKEADEDKKGLAIYVCHNCRTWSSRNHPLCDDCGSPTEQCGYGCEALPSTYEWHEDEKRPRLSDKPKSSLEIKLLEDQREGEIPTTECDDANDDVKLASAYVH